VGLRRRADATQSHVPAPDSSWFCQPSKSARQFPRRQRVFGPQARRYRQWYVSPPYLPTRHDNLYYVAVATRVMLPSIFSALTRIANQTDPLITRDQRDQLQALYQSLQPHRSHQGQSRGRRYRCVASSSTYPTTIFWLMIRFQKTTTL
jgi:hypothetical protein